MELGCGTGFLTQFVSENLEFENYTAIDVVEDCRNYIDKINPKINFVKSDIESYLKNDKTQYDLIISNASLQWIEDLKFTINNALNLLSADSRFIFSTFGDKNFSEIYKTLGIKLNYLSKNEISEMLIGYDFEIEDNIQELTFNNSLDILKHLKLTGVNAVESKTWTRKDIHNFEEAFETSYNGVYKLTYNPIYVVVSKN